ADRRGGRPRPQRVRQRDRLPQGHYPPAQVLPAAAAPDHHGTARASPLPPPRPGLLRRFRAPPAAPAGAVHPRDDPRLADPGPGRLVPPAPPPPVLPLRLRPQA